MELRGQSIMPAVCKKKVVGGSPGKSKPPKQKQPTPKATTKKKSSMLASKVVSQTRKSDISTLTPLRKGEISAPSKPTRTVEEEAQRLLSLPPDEALGCNGLVAVKFNHYNKKFEVYNGVLRWSAIDDEYCLSFVYKGNFTRELHIILSSNPTDTGVNLNSSEYKPMDSKLDWPKAERDDLGFYFIGIDTER